MQKLSYTLSLTTVHELFWLRTNTGPRRIVFTFTFVTPQKQIFLLLFVLAAFNKWLVWFICGYIQVLGTHENAVIFIRGIPPTAETHESIFPLA